MILEVENVSYTGLKVSEEEIKKLHRILQVKYLTPDTFIIRLERKNFEFKAGQHVHVKIPGNPKHREYSVYSGEQDDYLEFLVKEVKDGYLTPMLKKRKEGDFLQITGPAGQFKIRENHMDKKFLFIASGTGISPFHCYIKTYAHLDYKILHGVRYSNEAYEKDAYDPSRIVVCTTGDNQSDFYGRVTEYLKQNPTSHETLVYLCGNYNMIVDSMEILKQQGFPREQIYVETYF